MATTSTIAEDEKVYGREEIEPESEFAVLMRFPILYENATSDSDTNGIGPLSDTKSCLVTRAYNQFPTLQLTYKRDGIYAKELQNGRIIMTDMGPDLVHQKFRINQVQKSLDEIVVNATHIAGDIAYNTITKDLQIPSSSAADLFNMIITNLSDDMPDIRFDTDISTMSTVNMKMSSGNAGNLLIDSDQEGDEATQSLSALYKGEWIFDNYHFYFKQHAGDQTGLIIKYGRDIKTLAQDDNIANTYNAIFPYATYTSAPPEATDTNEDWNAIGSEGMTNIATATYAAGGSIDIYSSPVNGHHIVGSITNGSHIQLIKKITDGTTLPDKKVVNTVNGDDWYYVSGQGWIDAKWVTFDKSGDYLVNNAVGHYTVDIGTGSGNQTKYPFRGRGVVNYSGSIHAYYSPFFGAKDPGGDNSLGHTRTGEIAAQGEYIDFDYKAINEKGDVWYRRAGTPHCWYYGPHISFSKSGTYIEDQTANGTAAIKSGAQKYIMKGGSITPAPKQTKWVSTRTSKTKKYKSKTYNKKYHGKTIKQKKTVKNKAYTKGKKTTVKKTIPKGIYKIHGQYKSGGTTYYKTGNNTYVKSSDVDWKNRMSNKPQSIDKVINSKWNNGKIEMYSEPKFGTALNWGIPNGESFSTGATAHGDGEDWIQCTYHGVTGWVLAKYLKTKGDADFESYNPDDLESSDDTQDNTNVDVSDLTVTLPEKKLLVDSAYGQEVDRVQNVDLSSYFQHDYQDLSGLNETTGEYQVTQADIDQLRTLAQSYMKEHRFGYPNISLTLTAEQISDYQLDSIGLYDLVTVDFDPGGIYETAEVSSTTWDAMAHRYTEITIGDLPIDWEHELLQAADAKSNARASGLRESINRNGSLIQRYRYAMDLKEKGLRSDFEAAEQNLAKSLGAVKDVVTAHGKKIGEWEPLLDDDPKNPKSSTSLFGQLKKLDEANSQLVDEINGGGHSVIHAEGGWANPTSLTAKSNVGGFMKFNGDGLGYFTSDGKVVKTAVGADGTVYADVMNAGQIHAATIDSAVVTGAFNFSQGGINMFIGGQYHDINTGASYPINGIGLGSLNYSMYLSSGSLKIYNTGMDLSSILNMGLSTPDVQLSDSGLFLSNQPNRIHFHSPNFGSGYDKDLYVDADGKLMYDNKTILATSSYQGRTPTEWLENVGKSKIISWIREYSSNRSVSASDIKSALGIPSYGHAVWTGGGYPNLTDFVRAHISSKVTHGL